MNRCWVLWTRFHYNRNTEYTRKDGVWISLPQEKFVSLEEFYTMREKTDNLLEYVDGMVFMPPSPSIHHQRVSGRLHSKLFNFLDGKDCEVFHAPTDIELQRDDIEGNKIIIPDLSVICEKSDLQITSSLVFLFLLLKF